MADLLVWIFLIVWSVWGVVHCLGRKGIRCFPGGDAAFDDGGVKYEIKNRQKKTMVLFAEGPIIWVCSLVEVLWVVAATVTKFVLVVPFKALDKWAQEEGAENGEDLDFKAPMSGTDSE